MASELSGNHHKHVFHLHAERYIFFLTIAALLLAIPLTIRMTQQATDTRSKAAQNRKYTAGTILVKLKNKNASISETDRIIKKKARQAG